MKKVLIIFSAVVVLFTAGTITINYINAENIKKDNKSTLIKGTGTPEANSEVYKYPEFYRGIYLTVTSANSMQKLKEFTTRAKAANINTFVLDVQNGKYGKCIVPPENVQYCKDNGIHPIARIVIFPDGLKNWPVSEEYINDKLNIAESACINGFREIQFDYIRFNDSNKNKQLKIQQRYAFIESFLSRSVSPEIGSRERLFCRFFDGFTGNGRSCDGRSCNGRGGLAGNKANRKKDGRRKAYSDYR